MLKKALLLLVILMITFTSIALAQEELLIWDEFTSEPQNSTFQGIVDEFEAKHDVTVKRNSMAMENMVDVLKPAIDSGSGPDIFFTGPGWGGLGPYIEADAVMDLTSAFEERGWEDKIQPWAIDYVSYNKKIWSLPWEAEVQGLFYHKDLFAEYDLDVPETYQEFIEISEKFKEEGYIASVASAARPAYAIGWMESSWLGATMTNDELYNIVFEHGSWDVPEYINALERIEELYNKNYISKDILAYNYDDMTMLFYNQQTPMIAVGSWIVPEVEENYPDLDIGFFPVPPLPGVEKRTPKAIGGGFQISNNSEKKELAMKFFDHLLESDAGEAWLVECDLFTPLEGLDYSKYVSGVKLDIATRIGKPLHAFNLYGVLPNEVNDFTWNAIQSMWNGETTPEEIAEEKQELWEKAIEEGRVFK